MTTASCCNRFSLYSSLTSLAGLGDYAAVKTSVLKVAASLVPVDLLKVPPPNWWRWLGHQIVELNTPSLNVAEVANGPFPLNMGMLITYLYFPLSLGTPFMKTQINNNFLSDFMQL